MTNDKNPIELLIDDLNDQPYAEDKPTPNDPIDLLKALLSGVDVVAMEMQIDPQKYWRERKGWEKPHKIVEAMGDIPDVIAKASAEIQSNKMGALEALTKCHGKPVVDIEVDWDFDADTGQLTMPDKAPVTAYAGIYTKELLCAVFPYKYVLVADTRQEQGYLTKVDLEEIVSIVISTCYAVIIEKNTKNLRKFSLFQKPEVVQ